VAAIGSPEGGDPCFPEAGNGGYDVRSHAISLDIDPASGRIVGRNVVDAVALSVETKDFIVLAKEGGPQVSPARLDTLFDAWLYQNVLPALLAAGTPAAGAAAGRGAASAVGAPADGEAAR
jgi:hypothetical protein